MRYTAKPYPALSTGCYFMRASAFLAPSITNRVKVRVCTRLSIRTHGGQTLTTTTHYYPARTGPFVVSVGATVDIRLALPSEQRSLSFSPCARLYTPTLFVPFINIDLEWEILVPPGTRSATIPLHVEFDFVITRVSCRSSPLTR